MLHDGTSNAPDKRGDSTDKAVGADDEKIASALPSLVTFIPDRDHFIRHVGISCLKQTHSARKLAMNTFYAWPVIRP
jgi:hypothetical protein